MRAEFDERVKRMLKTNLDIAYVAEPKIDGLAVNLIYENGIFAIGATRGDGYTGEDVTTNLKTIKTIPLRMLKGAKSFPQRIEVRGEVYMGLKDFLRLNDIRTKRGERQLKTKKQNKRQGQFKTQLTKNYEKQFTRIVRTILVIYSTPSTL